LLGQCIHHYAFNSFQAVLYIQRKRTSIGFVGVFDRGRRVVINLIPGESSSEDGLRFQIYKTWFAERAGIPPADVKQLVPQHHEEFVSRDTDWSGFRGFIKSRDEIDRLASALPQGRVSALPQGRG
jgi:hypothetical protein